MIARAAARVVRVRPRATPLRPAAAAAPSAATRGFRIKSFEDVKAEGSVKVAKTGTWESRRYWLRRDGFGYSMHHTILYAGRQTLIHYKNHVELVFITHGSGQIEVVAEGQEQGQGVVHRLEPGTSYALDKHDRHFLRADDGADMHVVCTFNPPVDGREDHNEDGVYPVIDDSGTRF